MAEAAAARKVDSTRHKCFVSYHADDMAAVEDFIETFGSEFLARSVGVTIEDDFIDSDSDEYIKRRIREEYLTDSTVTILLLGQCTWARKFVDWEISSSLRNDTSNKRNGLLVYPLPSMNNKARLPGRVRDNWREGDTDASYVRYLSYPTSSSVVRSNIEAAFNDRLDKSDLVDNSRELKKSNSACT
ncbi:TIR domain-containing protein [Ruania alkalisoli]|uniref:TIR domain-containing protein n=1 Tax=Ruania alkalisoli TaxID=2779775 RepID=A0A7M1SPK6_9MICO|nr:TIR domain-containing protein [Ruania alkalisoli]